MRKKSTLDQSSDYCNAVKKGSIVADLQPQKSTLAFLKQFARVYHAEKTIPAQLSGFVLN